MPAGISTRIFTQLQGACGHIQYRCRFSRKQEEEVQELKFSLSKLVNNNENLEGRISQLSVCKAKLEARVCERNTSHAKLEFQASELTAFNVNLKAQVDSLNAYIRKLNAEVSQLADVKVNLLARVGSLTASNGQLNVQVSELTDHKALLEDRVSALSAYNGNLKVQVSALTDNQGTLAAELCSVQEQLYNELQGKSSYIRGSATPFDLECTHKLLQSAMSSCSNTFWGYAKSLQWNIGEELRNHSFPGTHLTRPGHVKQMLVAKMYQIFFQDFENDSFSPNGDTLILASNVRMAASFDDFRLLKEEDLSIVFGAHDTLRSFCKRKFEMFLLSWKNVPRAYSIENAMLRYNCLFVNDPVNPSSCPVIVDTMTPVLETFMRVGKIVWCLHKLSLSFQPRAEILRVSKHAEFLDEFMEAVDSTDEDENFVAEVGFLICPGFRVKGSIIRCQIYQAARSECKS